MAECVHNEQSIENEYGRTSLVTGCASSSNFNYDFTDSLFIEDVENRNLYLTNDVTANIFHQIVYFIIRCNQMDDEENILPKDRLPIKLYINSLGGNTWDGLACIEAIRTSKTPVYGICVGYALSMGFHIFTNCHKRFATKNAFFLNHDGTDGDYDSYYKVKDRLEFSEKLNNRLDDMLIKRTKMKKKYLTDTSRIENFMFADEAQKLGIVDVIINSFSDIV